MLRRPELRRTRHSAPVPVPASTVIVSYPRSTPCGATDSLLSCATVGPAPGTGPGSARRHRTCIWLGIKSQPVGRSSVWLSGLSVSARRHRGAVSGSFIEGGFGPGREPCAQPPPSRPRSWNGEGPRILREQGVTGMCRTHPRTAGRPALGSGGRRGPSREGQEGGPQGGRSTPGGQAGSLSAVLYRGRSRMPPRQLHSPSPGNFINLPGASPQKASPRPVAFHSC